MSRLFTANSIAFNLKRALETATASDLADSIGILLNYDPVAVDILYCNEIGERRPRARLTGGVNMLKGEIPVIDQARPFETSQLFFSTTDQKGLITSCNEVFLRVADYSPEQILGQPHNIIRHPDMPRCVFKLLWDYLLAGRPIGAYVKNRASTGEYYWVFALAAPIPNGFLSLRLKPTSPVIAAVAPLYRKLLDNENEFGSNWKAGMESSTKMLLAALPTLGFESYDDFMTKALRSELSAREAALQAQNSEYKKENNARQRGLDEILSGLGELDELQRQLKAREAFLQTLGLTVGRVSMNAAVRAAHFGQDQDGSALSAISVEVSRVSGMIAEESKRLGKEMVTLTEIAHRTSFNVSMAKIQQEMIDSFTAEQAADSLSEPEQIARYGQKISALNKLLADCVENSRYQTAESVDALRNSLMLFRRVTDSLEKILLTIQFSYVTGKTLAARLADGDKFSALLADLVSLGAKAREEINALNSAVSKVNQQSAGWGRLVRETGAGTISAAR